MDPLSITASVAGLATLAYQIIGYLGSVRAGGKDRLDLCREVTNLWMSITSLLEQLHPDKLKDDKVPDSLRPLFEPDGILKEIKQQLEELERRIKSQSSHGKIAQSLAWPFTQKDAEKLTQRIYRLKSILQDGINQSTHALAQDIYRDGHSVKKAVDEKQLRELIDWISPLNFVAKQSMIWNQHHQGTCKWFLERDDFREWREGENTCIFCPGIPGAGKTFLASIVYNELEGMRERGEGGLKGAAVIMLYCKWDDPLSQSPENLLSSIIKQFVQRYNVGVDEMMELFKKHSKDGTRPSIFQLLSSLELIKRRFTKVFIVLDGLDELKDENQRLPLISNLAPWTTRPSVNGTSINLMITSRPLPNIARHFRHRDFPQSYIICDGCGKEHLPVQYHCAACDAQHGVSYDLCYTCNGVKHCPYKGHTSYLQINARVISIAAVEEDLATYVRWRTSASDFLQQCTETTEGLMDLILDTVAKNNGGMFLLARFNMDTLDAKLNVKQVRAALQSLPQELDDTYEDAMSRIKELPRSTKDTVMQFLLWVVMADQPLHEHAIEHALAVRENTTDIDGDDIIRARILANKCAGLVQYDEFDCLRLVHYSAEGFFRENRDRYFPDGHSYIAVTCLSYLQYDVFRTGAASGPSEAVDFEARLQKYPFLRYASVSWGKHLRETNKDQLYDQTVKLLSDAGFLSTMTQALWYLDDQQKNLSWSAKNGSAVHLAVHFRLPRLVEALINQGFDPDIRDVNGRTPLALAVQGQQLEITTILTRAGVSINTIDNSGHAPLHRAVQGASKNIVKLLLAQKGVDVNISHERWSHFTPLIVAAANGAGDILTLLLSDGSIQVNKTCAVDNSTALIHAARSGSVVAVRVLLDHPGIDINHKDSSGNSALTSASDRGHYGVVEALLRKGADTEVMQEGSNGTAIMRAIDHGFTHIVELLMKSGTNLHHKDCFDRGILHSAAVNHRAEILRILLAYDPTLDVNMRDINGMTTMHDVARAGALEALEVLLEHGGDPSIKDNHGRTPILIAHEAHHVDVLQSLRAARARQKEEQARSSTPQRTETGSIIEDVKRADTGLSIPGSLPLWSLVRAKQFTELKERLPDSSKEEVNQTEPDMGQAALHWALCDNDERTARLLLEHGADINLQNKYGRTPLHIAVMERDRESLHMLLAAGADPNIEDIWDCPPLSMIDDNVRWFGVVLVEYGADIGRDNPYIDVYLRYAAYYGWEKSVRRLIAVGADVWGKDRDGKTPYMIAKERGHDEVASLILQLAPKEEDSASKPAESGSGSEKPAVAPKDDQKSNGVKVKGEHKILLASGHKIPDVPVDSAPAKDVNPSASLFARHFYTLLLVLLLITATTLARVY